MTFFDKELSNDDARQLNGYISMLNMLEMRSEYIHAKKCEIYGEVKTCGFKIKAVRTIVSNMAKIRKIDVDKDNLSNLYKSVYKRHKK
jgi:uncharacterized protein (UPF0335 family)